jgi:adenine phosphoribosyltransferase
MDDLKSIIRDIPDFPKKGIIFKDITTLLKDGGAFKKSIDELAAQFKGQEVDLVVGAEARGFIFGAALAYKLGAGFVPVRKPKKLPAKTLHHEYALEYGTDALEIHVDAIAKGQRVLVVDDLLATGGTIAAVCAMVEKLGGNIVGVGFLIELGFLAGRKKLGKYNIVSLINYDSE